jgi:hypothetical protein
MNILISFDPNSKTLNQTNFLMKKIIIMLIILYVQHFIKKNL